MTPSLRLSLKAGEKIFVNGAVLQVDRKVSIELLNDAQFLLSHHVVSAAGTTTPLRQLYFIIQRMLMRPEETEQTLLLYRETILAVSRAYDHPDILAGLYQVSKFIDDERPYDGLKALRKLFAIEAQLLGGADAPIDRAGTG